MTRRFGVYCSSGEEAYRGDFSEVPEPYRSRLIEAIDEWGDVMQGWGLNELIYSLMCWHEKKVFECARCDSSRPEPGVCADCGRTLEPSPRYPKSDKISRLLMCVGSINRISEEKI